MDSGIVSIFWKPKRIITKISSYKLLPTSEEILKKFPQRGSILRFFYYFKFSTYFTHRIVRSKFKTPHVIPWKVYLTFGLSHEFFTYLHPQKWFPLSDEVVIQWYRGNGKIYWNSFGMYFHCKMFSAWWTRAQKELGRKASSWKYDLFVGCIAGIPFSLNKKIKNYRGQLITSIYHYEHDGVREFERSTKEANYSYLD